MTAAVPAVLSIPARGRTVRRILWALGAAVLLGFTGFEAIKHGSLTALLAAAGVVGPDVTMLLGIGQDHQPRQLPRRAVRAYDLAHHPIPPATLLVLTTGIGAHPALFTLALAWLGHIALDRVAGYGRRTADGWQEHRAG